MPGQNVTRGWGAATAAAADHQKQLSFLNATQAITGQRAGALSKSVLQLSRDLPVGERSVAQTVQTVQQLGVALQGQEKQVASLSRTFIQLGSANGGSAPQFAVGLSQLERTFGDQGLDPKKIRDTGDALTTVSKLSGASAQSTLDFANAIAPIAQNAGVGKAATLGIAAGFARIGQDGTYAATAVTKVLSDLNNAVRYGGPQLNTYANIVGTTAGQFEKLYKANPAGALNQVFQSIGQSGQQGPLQLQSLGLDGVRTQRAIQAISSQGGLQTQISQAIAGYGSGATQKASDANFNNVVDNLSRAGESAKQLAIAFGEPLLRPLGTFASVLAHVTGGIAGATGGLLNNRVVSAAVGYGGLALVGARLGLRVGTAATIGNQLVRSTPVGALSAGLRIGRGAEVVRNEQGAITQVGRAGVFGTNAGFALNRYENNGLGRVSSSALGLGLALGGRGPGAAGQEGAVGPFSRVRNLGVNSANFFGNLAVASQVSALNPDPTARNTQFRETLAARNPFARYITPQGAAAGIAAGGDAALLGPLTASAKNASASLGNLGRESAGLRGVFGSLARYAGSTLTAPARILGQPGVGSSLANVGGSALGFLGRAAANPFVLATGGFALYNHFQNNQRQYNQVWRDFGSNAEGISQNPTQFIDTYNQALGKATDATQTFAQALASASQNLSSQSSYSSALQVGPQDITAAAGQKGQKVTYPDEFHPNRAFTNIPKTQASEGEIAAYIRSGSTGGLQPGQIQAIKLDLIKQYGPTKAQKIIDQLGVGSGGQFQGYGSGQQNSDFQTLVGLAGGQEPTSPGFGAQKPNKALTQTLGVAFQGIQQEYNANSLNVGTQYATQQEYRSVNQGAQTVAQSGNSTLAKAYVTQAWIALGGTADTVPKGITLKDIQDSNGDLVSVFAKKDPKFGATWRGLQKQGVSLSGPGVSSSPVLSNLGQSLSGFGYASSQFDNRLGSQAQYGPGNLNPRSQAGVSAQSSLSFLQAPEDLGKLNKAIDDFVATVESGAKGVRGSSDQLGSALSANVSELGNLQTLLGRAGDNTPQSQLIQGQIAQLNLQRQASSPFLTTPQNIGYNLSADARTLQAGPGNSKESQSNYNQAKQDYAQQIDALANFEKQRILQNNQYQTQVYRSTQSFQLQIGRANQDFYTQQVYAAEDFSRSRTYAYEDYFKQVMRQERDFGIQIVRATQDYQHQVSVATRDFNIQLGRQISDQAQALYDPYKRIQTQAIWDGHQLVANLAEQNQAVVKQAAQIQQIRRAGVSNLAIQQLGLNDPANAQQLSKLIADIQSDPKIAAQLNAAAKTRQSVGSSLLSDPSNKDIARAKDDFHRQLSDLQYDFSTQIARSKADFQKTLADEYVDFSTQLQRQQADYSITQHRSQQQFNTQMGRLQQDFGIQLAQMKQDLDIAETEITISTGDLFTNLNKLTQGKINDVLKVEKTGLADTLKIIQDPKNQGAINNAYKNLFPYDLSKIFGGPGPGLNAPRGGPYAPYSNAAAQQGLFAGARTGGMGGMVNPYVSQGFGGHSAGAPSTGGGWPVAGAIDTQDFGHQGHPGIDLAVPRGTPIHAPLPGIVVYAGWNDGYGNCVIMDNGGGRSTLYGHQQGIAAKVGQKLSAGDLIGWVDSTGNSTGDHLHFETRVNGIAQNPAVDLPIWQATAGLGSFDPGAVAASYGVGGQGSIAKLKKGDFYNKKLGPFGALIEGALAMQALNQEASDANLSDSGNFPSAGPQTGPLQDYARKLLGRYGWGSQWNDFNYLENREAGWNVHATNPQSGAYGLAQALPASKYNETGKTDWHDNGYTQLDWMFGYIDQRYHSVTAAAEHERALNWYGLGGIFPAGRRRVIGVGDSNVVEAAVPMNNAGVRVLATAMSQAISGSELARILTPGSTERVTYVSQYSLEDHSVNFPDAHITVESSDPMEFGRKMEAQARNKNLVSAPRGASR